MNKKLLLLIIPALMYADDLKSLLDFATTNNKIVLSKNLTQEANLKDVESLQNAYYPTLNVGASYQRYDDKSLNIPGDKYSAFAKVGMDLYDGERNSNSIKQKKAVVNASKYTTSSYKKNLQMLITENFFNIKSADATLNSLKDKENKLLSELDRIQKFFDVGSATQDEIDRLRAEYSDNLYQIDQVKYQILSLKKLLGLKIGKRITSLDNSFIEMPQDIKKELSDDILLLKANASAMGFSANVIEAEYLPQVRIEDTYSYFGYDRTDASHPKGLDNQNNLLLTLNLKLFDMGAVSKEKESLIIQKQALLKEAEQLEDEQDINIELALLKIKTTKAQINSAKSSLESASSAYDTIAMKYSVGAVDNVTYLDALSVKTNAASQYETALNNLQIDYAKYYYFTNKDIKEFIK